MTLRSPFLEVRVSTATTARPRQEQEEQLALAAERLIAASCDPAHGMSDEARELVRALASTCLNQVRAARQALTVRDQVLGAVAHDLRDPLNTIVTSVDLLQLPMNEEQRTRQLNVILRSALRMDRLIQDLLDVVRLESSQLNLQQEWLPAADIARDAVEMHATRAAASSQALRFFADADLPLIRGDRHRLQQALSNLLDNAIRYTPSGGSIDVQCTRINGCVRYTVADTGPGIPPADLPNLFAAFWQGRRSSPGGTGLGLAIARGVVEAHGGSIGAENRPGGGALFSITIPAGEAQLA